MDFEFNTVEKPNDWPTNAREHDIELIDKAIDEFEAYIGVRPL